MAEKWLAAMQAQSSNRYPARASHDSFPLEEDPRGLPSVRRSANNRRNQQDSPERTSASFRSGNERSARRPAPCSADALNALCRHRQHPCVGGQPPGTLLTRGCCPRLYEAYNDLHSLAQDFEKPFDAPAILCAALTCGTRC